MADKWIEPSPVQQTHARLAQLDLVETVNRLIRDGMDSRVVLSALGAATADVITCTFGATAVVPWFEMQAKVARDLQRPS